MQVQFNFEIDLLPERLYFGFLATKPPKKTGSKRYISISSESLYRSFAHDFGPPNLAVLYKFCRRIDRHLSGYSKICYFVQQSGAPCTNAIFLLGAYLVLYQNQTPHCVMMRFQSLSDFILPYVDASEPPCTTFTINLFDCWSALQKAKQHKLIDMSKFNCREYEHWEKPDHGDLNWIIPNKLLAFASPDSNMPPSHFIPYFKANRITTIIRLNSELYSAKDFTQKGFEHFDLIFPDGSAPSLSLVKKFLNIVNRPNSVVAVHCKKGLGRTGTLNACYIMKYYDFTAKEAIAYMRIIRPGSILGIQQHFLASFEQINLHSLLNNEMLEEPNMLNSSPTHCSQQIPTNEEHQNFNKQIRKSKRKAQRSKQYQKEYKC